MSEPTSAAGGNWAVAASTHLYLPRHLDVFLEAVAAGCLCLDDHQALPWTFSAMPQVPWQGAHRNCSHLVLRTHQVPNLEGPSRSKGQSKWLEAHLGLQKWLRKYNCTMLHHVELHHSPKRWIHMSSMRLEQLIFYCHETIGTPCYSLHEHTVLDEANRSWKVSKPRVDSFGQDSHHGESFANTHYQYKSQHV